MYTLATQFVFEHFKLIYQLTLTILIVIVLEYWEKPVNERSHTSKIYQTMLGQIIANKMVHRLYFTHQLRQSRSDLNNCSQILAWICRISFNRLPLVGSGEIQIGSRSTEYFGYQGSWESRARYMSYRFKKRNSKLLYRQWMRHCVMTLSHNGVIVGKKTTNEWFILK